MPAGPAGAPHHVPRLPPRGGGRADADGYATVLLTGGQRGKVAERLTGRVTSSGDRVANQPANPRWEDPVTVARPRAGRVRDAVVRGERARAIARRAARAAAHMPRCPRHCRFRQLPRSFGWCAVATSKASRHNSGSITSPGRTARALSRSRGTARSLPSRVPPPRPIRGAADTIDAHLCLKVKSSGRLLGPAGRTSTASRGGGGRRCVVHPCTWRAGV